MSQENYEAINNLCIPKLNFIDKHNKLHESVEHKNIDNELIYIINGKMEFQINRQRHKVKAGDLYYVQPGQYHKIDKVYENVGYYRLAFFYIDENGEQFDIFKRTQNSLRQIINEAGSDFINILESIEESKDSIIAIQSLIIYAINNLRRKVILQDKIRIKKENIDYYSKEVIKLTEYVDKNIKRNLTYNIIAKEIGLNKRTFPIRFKNLTGISLKKYIDNKKIEQTKIELISTKKHLKDIAKEYNFYDQSHFDKIFIKKEGISPDDFRKKYKQEKG